MIRTIAAREFRNLFVSPLAWTVLGVLQVVLAWLFLNQVDAFLDLQPRLADLAEPPGVGDMVAAPLFQATAMLLLLIAPILAMRLIAEERRSHTLALLYSAPVSLRAIVAGKFLGLWGFLCIVVALPTLMALSLYAGAPLDIGLIAANVAGLALFAGGCGALGLYFSCLAAQPAVAAVGGIGAALCLWLLDIASGGSALLDALSPLRHFARCNRGLLDTADIVYFLAFAATFLALSVIRLDRDRMP